MMGTFLFLIRMTTEQVKEILKTKTEDDRDNGFHMMATKAYHQLGDISSDGPDICFIYNETKDFYIGNWIFGFGFFDVLYPKETTRTLTEEEINRYNCVRMAINGNSIGQLKVIIKGAVNDIIQDNLKSLTKEQIAECKCDQEIFCKIHQLHCAKHGSLHPDESCTCTVLSKSDAIKLKEISNQDNKN